MGSLRPTKDLTREPVEVRQGQARRDLVIVGKTAKPIEGLNYSLFAPDRLKRNTKPPLFEPGPFLDAELKMFTIQPHFSRPTLAEHPTHDFPRYRGPETEYIKFFEYLDLADRLHLFPARGTPLWRISQCFNVYHSPERDRGITNKKGLNGECIRLIGPSKFLPTAEYFCERPLRIFEAKLMFRRDVADMYGCIKCARGRIETDAVGAAYPEHKLRHLKSWSPSLIGLDLLGAPTSLAQGDGDAVEISTASHTGALREKAGVLTP